MTDQTMSQEYHEAHLAFARSHIIEVAARRGSIFGLLHQYAEDARKAERDRLTAENERLRETLKAIDSFPSHVIDGDKGGRWIEYGDGDGYWDDGDVHTDDCPACALSRRIDEALGLPGASDDQEAHRGS